ncbi:MAG: aldolase [Planctomycetes bacterium]|nr:aldolase [Planctomycetota bacterium]
MRTSRVKSKLRNNEPALVTCLHLTDPSLFEMTSLLGFDGIWMDLEHHGYSVETATTLMRAARVGVSDIMARPAKGEFMRLGRLLEAGATGIMYPRCRDAAEAREVVAWSKFAPLGTRGFDGGNADMPYCAMPVGEYIRKANDETFIVIQIEDEHAVGQAEDIARVEGVDILFFGPSDFTILAGIPGQFDHPSVDKALVTVAEAARKAGKHWGMPAWNMELAQKLMGMGARFLASGADIVMVKTALEDIQRRFKPLGFTFDNRLGK